MALVLKTLGALTLEGQGAPSPLRVRRRPLVLLAFIVGSGRDGVSREKALAYFWPDSDEERARSSLRQSLFTLRRDAGADVLSVGDHTLRVDTSILRVDAWEFEDALAQHDHEAAAQRYGGPFLDGVSLAGLGELDLWADARRRHYAARHADALRALVADAAQRGDIVARVRWARRLAAADPLSAATALTLLEALSDAGDRSAALDFGRVHAARIRTELGLEPDPMVLAYLETLRRQATPARAMPALTITTPTSPTRVPTAEDVSSVVAWPAEGIQTAPFPAASAGDTSSRAAAPPSAATPPREHRVRRAFVGALGVALAAAAIALANGWSPSNTAMAERDPAGPPPPAIAIAPFRVITTDGSVRLVGDSAAALLGATLRGAGLVDVLDHIPASTGLEEGDQPAALLLSGEIVGGRDAATLRVVLTDARDHRMVDAVTVVEPVERLIPTLDRIAVRALAAATGEPTWRLDALGAHSRAAVALYLAGQAAMRRGARQEAEELYMRAIATDSTLALAALGLARATGLRFGSTASQAASAPWRAYALRDSLVPNDRALFDAFADPPDGPRPSATRLAAWERAARMVPDQAEVWYELGDVLFHEGRRVGADDPWGRAHAAFTRARQRDRTYAPAVAHLLELAAASGDSAALRVLAESYFADAPDADVLHFLRWRTAVAFGDGRARARIRADLGRASVWSLMRIVGMSQIDGVGLEDGAAALEEMARSTPNGAAAMTARVAELTWALNGGRTRDALHSLERFRALSNEVQPFDRLLYNPDQGAVLAALFWDGDSSMAARGAAAIEARFPRPTAPGLRGAAEHAADACVLALWRVAAGDTRGARASLATIPPPIPADAVPCFEIARAWVGVADGAAADAHIERLDAYMRSGPTQFGCDFGNLVLARLTAERGQPAVALAALRRRAYHWTDGPWYLSTYLREEARVAAVTGDTAAAVRAYRHYLALRANAAPRSAVDDEVRHALAELESAL